MSPPLLTLSYLLSTYYFTLPVSKIIQTIEPVLVVKHVTHYSSFFYSSIRYVGQNQKSRKKVSYGYGPIAKADEEGPDCA
ncbi:hypothetical protein [Telluribacter sp. SYSU D00476]|uniref:hypothetical protein n=1 Tax=Telluribacter sp. SYSU D00476 TaxID=2811430 RepID=UPI001FF297DA|nr:hypothetical protein [Telluribacter sp. SYSU D00476]